MFCWIFLTGGMRPSPVFSDFSTRFWNFSGLGRSTLAPGCAIRHIPLSIRAMKHAINLIRFFSQGIGIVSVRKVFPIFFKISENLHVTL